MNSPRTLVIIPTYNERDNLPRVVPLVLAQDDNFHILVVDDNSPDGTGDVADSLAKTHREPQERLFVLHRKAKDGLGAAYVAGFRWGLERGYEVMVEMDADLSHPPDLLPELVGKLGTADVAVGSRYVGGRRAVVNWSPARLAISLAGCWYARIITRLPIYDATGGFNAFRRKVIAAIDLNRIQSSGYSFQIELKLRAWRRGFTLEEVPFVFTERESGESKMSRAIVLEAAWKVWKLRLLDLFGKL